MTAPEDPTDPTRRRSDPVDPDLRLGARLALPDALRRLVEDLPQDAWSDHPGFGGLTLFWLERHAGFRSLLKRISDDARTTAIGSIDVQDYAPQLYRHARTLLGELHGHHSIEDAQYFPQLRRLEPSVSRGFDLLEADHRDLDLRLHEFAGAVNGLLQAAQSGALARSDVERFADTVEGFRGLLDRHLVDEEEIVIPVLLRLSGG
ncbi:MAG: hemerythrin domain-containing protein [Alphaproteobacteria bacterium]|nr:hemerythrin domain-containing protein [Alphaproteobacteria bacterium]